MPAQVSDIDKLAVKDTTAARMLDLSAAEFRKLVSAGALPPPARIGTHERWNVDQLRAILRGDAARPNDDFE